MKAGGNGRKCRNNSQECYSCLHQRPKRCRKFKFILLFSAIFIHIHWKQHVFFSHLSGVIQKQCVSFTEELSRVSIQSDTFGVRKRLHTVFLDVSLSSSEREKGELNTTWQLPITIPCSVPAGSLRAHVSAHFFLVKSEVELKSLFASLSFLFSLSS